MNGQARRGIPEPEGRHPSWPMAGPRPRPSPGDVLASERSARADVYAISIVPAEAHASARRYVEAIRVVCELARELNVDGWFTSDQTHYVRVWATGAL